MAQRYVCPVCKRQWVTAVTTEPVRCPSCGAVTEPEQDLVAPEDATITVRSARQTRGR